MLSTLCLAVLGPLCSPQAEADAPMFAERLEAFFTADGEPLDVRTTCGSPAKDYIVEVNGGGLALADFDRDGDIDLAVVDGSTLERASAGEPGFPPRLFMNRGDGTFEPAGPSWQMAGGRWGMGCATGDLDGDGWIDLVSRSGAPTACS